MSFRDRGKILDPELFGLVNSRLELISSVSLDGVKAMDEKPKRRGRYRWPKEARDLVKEYLSKGDSDDEPSQGGRGFRDLVTRLNQLTSYPREACLYFARQLGVKDRQRYKQWTEGEQQKLLDMITLHPPHDVAKLMRRSIGSIRGMLHLLGATAQMGREWFTVYTLAQALHIRVQEVQRWIAQGWLKSRIVETGKLKKSIIDPDDFEVFCKRYRTEIVGRHLNAERLDFVHVCVSSEPCATITRKRARVPDST